MRAQIIGDPGTNITNHGGRIYFAFISAGVGGLTSMALLRVFHGWAYATEFDRWATMIAVHSLLVFGFVTTWFWGRRSNLAGGVLVKRGFGAASLGGVLAIIVWPYGFALLVSGQAFVTSGVAAVAYISMVSQIKA